MAESLKALVQVFYIFENKTGISVAFRWTIGNLTGNSLEILHSLTG